MSSSQEVYLDDSNNDRQPEMAAEAVYTCTYVYFRFRPRSWLSQWMNRRSTFFWRDPSTLPCSKAIMQHFAATRCVLEMMTYTFGIVRHLENLQLPLSVYSAQSFSYVTSVKFTSVLHRRIMSVVAKSFWHIDNYISGTMTDSVEVPTPNSGFSMITSSI